MEEERKQWFVARKKPVVIAFREVSSEGEFIETREGTLEATPEIDYIIRGVAGEEYPISKEIFEKTYNVLNRAEMDRFPIIIKEKAILEMIDRARALEWVANHQFGKYNGLMREIWALLDELYDLDSENHVYTMASEIPTIYYVKEIVKEFETETAPRSEGL